MIELTGDIFKIAFREYGKYDAFLVTTNGFWNTKGEAIMGAGVAGSVHGWTVSEMTTYLAATSRMNSVSPGPRFALSPRT